MILSRSGYLIREGFRSIKKHGFMSFASVTIIMACLIIMGSVSLLSLNINALIKDLENQNEIVVFVDESLSDEAMARDLQRKASEAGQPWTICKGFDGSAAIGEWVPKEKFLDMQSIHFHLDINGQTVQEGCTSDMLYRVDEIIAYISQFFTLKTGDLLYTGTPAGVGPVHINDHLEGWLEERKVLEFNCK